ncbi:hypothetical protein [Chitinophaga cymbidii]|uniref:Uncharacterized protein n=1 Tax=Chitinophaga cymbidii TaxID=1096750 RepID=A0A512RK69_9BACT|nr:hypothetical protein [Chitinophaga cymbidii]GEP96089.1 hypothetical protein CCY01nite_23490 [Chitinophaga cymbidii]
MEKISALIDKLQELKNSDAGLQTISYYTQLLQAEILHQRNLQRQQDLKGHGHVAVILPAHTPVPVAEKAVPPQQEKAMQNGYAQDRVPVKSRPQEQAATLFDLPQQRQQPAQAPQEDTARAEEPVNNGNYLHTNPAQESANKNSYQHPSEGPVNRNNHPHPSEEPANRNNYQQTPTETPANKNNHPAEQPAGNHLHTNPPQPATEMPVNKYNYPQPAPEKPADKHPSSPETGIRKELNELISRNSPSLNDALSNKGKVELGERLGGMGVKDLKDAIGINDKFQFIQSLFRSDKTMYDRSVKTINESTSLQEAENWMERELKIKLGWNESDPLVKQFYSLVRKRFS